MSITISVFALALICKVDVVPIFIISHEEIGSIRRFDGAVVQLTC